MDTQTPVANKHWPATALYLLIILLGQTRLAPDSDASVRVVVQDFGKGKPIAGAHVEVSLKPAGRAATPLFEGQTDETGSLPVTFHVPADAPAEAQLVVETKSAVGRDRIEQPVTIQREYRLLLTSDKPLYQPGQIIHMRALALSTLDLTPARGATVDFLVEERSRCALTSCPSSASRSPPTVPFTSPVSAWREWCRPTTFSANL